MSTARRGELYDVRPDLSTGKEIQKTRPCVIVSADVFNEYSGLAVVCPLTEETHLSADLIHVAVNKGQGGTTKDSIVLCDQVKAVDQERLMAKRGNLDAVTMQKIDKGLRSILSLH
ncbi:MAG TPA: type II toxin-antitoxin system PemK/MazF family toxin, partial [Bacteroidota bacterium]|nr:type II toxin-antitoxin system PemK/MazF family toxin [Bacteroidota bacterium]